MVGRGRRWFQLSLLERRGGRGALAVASGWVFQEVKEGLRVLTEPSEGQDQLSEKGLGRKAGLP